MNNSNKFQALVPRDKALGNSAIPKEVALDASFAEFKVIVFSLAVFHKTQELLPGGWLRTASCDIETIKLNVADIASAIIAADKIARKRNFQRYCVKLNRLPVWGYDHGKRYSQNDALLASWHKELYREQDNAPLDRRSNRDGHMLGSANRTVTVQPKPTLPVRKREPRIPQLITHMGDSRVAPLDGHLLFSEQVSYHRGQHITSERLAKIARLERATIPQAYDLK